MTPHGAAPPARDRFAADTEPFRRELVAHCYRMTGSAHDAEDLVQEAYLRAWRSYDAFEGRASVRTWLYTIATNVCLTALRSRRPRLLPSGLGGAQEDPDRPPDLVGPGEVSWLEPLPDGWTDAPADDPAATVVARESLRLALIASLQHLPARQRAIFLLRDVLAFSALETAAVLDASTAAVKSGLQRARARLHEVAADADELLEPSDPRTRALLDGYVAAFERSDARLLEQVLRADAVLEATPFRQWQAGRTMCVHVLRTFVLATAGDWRMVGVVANGQPAAAVYRRDPAGALRADGVVVLAPTATGIARVVKFHDPALVPLFGLPDVLRGAGGA
ncbi:RNA polymerase subunit sigma-70 [Actinomycetospora straminea]|uniref:RNA polymerase sigma factor n=1 Tax=Actinomycetospora straminea TaxID=663607 RepID=A0ABP9E7L1_9PSEU|nr:RNA polymerase subunit sigma-70 [Actinomycetospora straminea]MDD7935977.1 RNA polymerase subunit sigma-70 [Actinomycetospora straminea]